MGQGAVQDRFGTWGLATDSDGNNKRRVIPSDYFVCFDFLLVLQHLAAKYVAVHIIINLPQLFMTKRNGNVAYLDGVRGIAAFLVFLHHFCLAFYPALYSVDMKATHLQGGAEITYGHSLFRILINGNFYVQVFFVLSGFVLSRKYFITNDLELVISGAHRRFLRLYIPVTVTVILSYILLVTGSYFNIPVCVLTHSEAWLGKMCHFYYPFNRLLSGIGGSTIFQGDSSFVATLWTLSIEFYGSLFVFAFLAFTHFTKYRVIFLLLAMYYFFFTDSYYYMSFVFGISLNYTERWLQNVQRKYVQAGGCILLILALVLGSYPSNNMTEGTIFENLGNSILAYHVWGNAVGAYLLIFSFMCVPLLQRIVNVRPLRFLGYISFSLYLLHPVLLGSWSSWLFLEIHDGVGYGVCTAVVFLSTVALLIPISWLMAKYVDQFGIRFAKRVYEYVRKPRGIKEE